MKIKEEFNYYDGPLSGICEEDGQYYWFDTDFQDSSEDRVYQLWPISREEYITLCYGGWDPLVDVITDRISTRQIKESEFER